MPCRHGCCDSPREHYKSLNIDSNIRTKEFLAERLELRRYEEAVSEGIQPMSTKLDKIDQAFAVSDHTGRAYNGADLAGTYYPEHAAALREWTPEEKKSILSGE